MRVVMDWLAEHVELPPHLTAEQLAADLVRVGLEEETIHTAGVTGPLVVGRVIEMVPEVQKNGKTINWCQVDVGSHNALSSDGAAPLPRGIVCGAHNFQAGDFVVVALPGATLPGPFVISARKTYGHISDGMICSQRELGLGDDHDGIIVLTRMGFALDQLVPGADALGLLGLGNDVLEINITPDRGYCFSYRGIAREYALATGASFTDGGLGQGAGEPPSLEGFPVHVDDRTPIHAVQGCDRFATRIVRGIDPAAATPEFMVRRLKAAGMRSISLAVDITNYVMLDLGQPLHAYDLSLVSAPIVVRRARQGERLTTLDDVDRALDGEDLLITDSPAGDRGARVLGLAGVMGGASSEVTSTTTDVLLEAAHFDPVTVARSARRHRLSTEAAKRFERGVDPLLPGVATYRAAQLLVTYGGGTMDLVVGGIDQVAEPRVIICDEQLATRIVGLEYSRDHVIRVLTSIGCEVSTVGEGLQVQVPSWRPDLDAPIDLVEEIARVTGYDRIPVVLPQAPPGRGLTRAQRVRRSVGRGLAESGWVEVFSYPFVGEGEYGALGLQADDPRRHAVRLVNPLAEDRPLMRTSLLMTLLDTARRNHGRGNVPCAVFELGMVTHPVAAEVPALPGGTRPSADQLAELWAGVPDQPHHVAGVMYGPRERASWQGPAQAASWQDAVAAARLVAERAGAELQVSAATDIAPWHPGRCAQFTVADGTVVGFAGELHPKVCENFGLPARAVAFEMNLDALIAARCDEAVQARPVSVFPMVKEDLAFVVDQGVAAADVAQAIVAGGGDLVEDVHLFDIYVGPQLAEGKKSLAFSLRLRGDSTLAAEDTALVRAQVVERVRQEVGGQLRG